MLWSNHPATEAYQDFVAWVDENSVLGARGAAAESNYAFLPVTRLQSYVDRRQLSKLLEVLFKDDVPPDHRILREKYSKVFCILLYIGKGEYIEHFMQHESLNDQRLPFDPQRPTHFPRDPNDQEFFSNFYKTQCMLCVPKFHYNIAEKFEKDRILPITEKCRIDARGSAEIYRIKIHEAYDRLVPLGNGQKDFSNHPPTYILKTYRTRDAEKYYRAEVGAFRKLTLAGKPPSNLIGFYRSFVQDYTYNVILKFADKGNLKQYFRTTSPPSSREDKVSF